MRHLSIPDSDTIDSIGFELPRPRSLEKDRLGVLEVIFKSSADTIYRYENVNADVIVALITADSIGKTFHEHFRKTKYPFTKSERKKPTLSKGK